MSIPDDIKSWLQEMQQKHAGLCAGVSPDTPSWQKRFVALLARRSDVFCFEQMFFEFMGHFHEAEYCAAVALLEECADNRTKYRRLLAVMANEELREEAFQF